MRCCTLKWAFSACAAALLLVGNAWATLPYMGLGEGVPAIGPGLASPKIVPGKEYSHDRDHEITAVGTAPDPKQIVAWDGSGGVANGQDFSPPIFPTVLVDFEVDAIAHHRDALFDRLLDDSAHLLFSLDLDFVGYGPGMVPFAGTLPSGTPPGVLLKNGNIVGGAGEISYELGLFGGVNGPETQGVWATQAEINGMPLPDDIDGLEVWGPEPGFTADVDKLSLRLDAATGGAGPLTSVFNGDGSTYITLAMIEGAVTSLLGDLPTHLEPDRVNLDALMVNDIAGEDTDFGRDPAGGSALDRIIFSIDQIEDPLDADGYYATGSELMVLDAAGGAFFLDHGGHLWDHKYALDTFSMGTIGDEQGNFFVFDIDAIEGMAEGVVPEPTSVCLMLLGTVGVLVARRVAL